LIIFILFSVQNSIILCCAILVASDVLNTYKFNIHFTNSFLSAVTLTYKDSSHPKFQISCPFFYLLLFFLLLLFLRSFQWIFRSLRSCVIFCNMLVSHSEELLHPLPNPQAGEPPFVGCPLLIHSYPPYPAAIFAHHDLRTGHVTVTQTHLSWAVVKCDMKTGHHIKSQDIKVPVRTSGCMF
jgi:hypothetical protein